MKEELRRLLLTCFVFSSGFLQGASEVVAQFNAGEADEFYYLGINPVAPFSAIRSTFTSGYLPAISNLESGLSVFVGKIWQKRFNVETRLSYGSPIKGYRQFVVQSGGMYRFKISEAPGDLYTGIFVKIENYSLHHHQEDYLSLITYITIGKRIFFKQYFIDFRLNENIAAISWSSEDLVNTHFGFQRPLYKWRSPYIPFGTVNIGFFFR